MDENPQSQDQASSAQPPTQQTSSNDNLPPKKSKTGLIVGIVVGVIALVGIIVAVVLALTIFSSPSKEDYKEAHAQVVGLKEYRANYLSWTPNENFTMNEYKESTREFKEEFKEELNNLGKMKAVINDKDIEKPYNEVRKKLVAFYHHLDVRVEFSEKMSPIMNQYTGINTNPSTAAGYREKARKYEVIVGDLKSQVHKEFVEDVIKNTKAMAEACEKKEPCDHSMDVDDLSVPVTQLGILRSEQREIIRKWFYGLRKIRENGEITKDLDVLESLLAKKTKEAK